MRRHGRVLRLVPLTLLATALAGAAALAVAPPDPVAEHRATAVAPVRAATGAACDGITHREVLGPKPHYASHKLSRFAGDDTLCSGIWLPKPRVRLVPQSMTLGTHHTAWLVGYRWGPKGERPCRLFHVDLRTGKRLSYQPRVVGRVGTQPQQYCRHGGGVVRAHSRLWIAEKHKLWMYDPRNAGSSPQAERVWRIQMPVQGSSIVVSKTRIGLVPFVKKGTPQIRWYDFDAVLGEGVTDLADEAAPPKQIAPDNRTTVPTFVQGAMFSPRHKLWVSRSSTRCGELRRLDGRGIAFIPGAEAIQVSPRRDRLWVVSESGAQPFQKAGKQYRPLTPGISSFEWPRVMHGPPSQCHFD